ncbi:MAG: PAS domain-containing protein [Lachnospiraceae bacterium]|nr:PAS domain-containing protein [Lachnospiraceae bacterium]
MGIFSKKTVTDDSSAKIAELEKQLKECNEKLALSEYELETVNRCAHLGLWTVKFDEAGNMTKINFTDEFRKLLGGYTTDELKNDAVSLIGIMHPEDADAVNGLFAAAVADKTGRTKYDIEYRLMTKQGSYKWVHAAGECIRSSDGSPRAFIGTFHDIDQAVKNENEVKMNNVRRTALDRLMEEGSWSVDLTQYAMDDPSSPCMYNRQLKRILGFEDNDPEFPDNVGGYGSRIHPEDFAYAVEARDDHFEDPNVPVINKEFRMRKKNGEVIWVRARNTIVRSEDGMPQMMAGTIMDITKDKQNQLKFKNEMSPNIEALRKGIAEISKTVDIAAHQMIEVASRQGEVNDSAKGIEKSVKASKNILNSIEGIASQTNLLSLNASIEAARVGEAGRGFSVVAKNVRELSDSTKKTTEHIAEILNGMNDSVKDIQEKIELINESVQSEKEEMEVIDATLQQLYASADEIARMAGELYK